MYSLGVIYFPRKNEQVRLIGRMEKVFPSWLTKYALEITPIVSDAVILESLDIKVEEIQFPYFFAANDNVATAKFKRAVIRTKEFLSSKDITQIIFDGKESVEELYQAFSNQKKELKIFDKTDFYGIFISEILKYICKKMGIKLQKLPVTMILDDMDEFFEDIIKNLCTKVRFLSIISLNYENFIPMVNEIYNEIGLVVRLEKNLKYKRGDYGIIINFSKDKNLVNSNKFSRNHITLNFGAEILNNSQNGILITDIIIKSKNKDINKYPWAVTPAFCESFAYKLANADVKDRMILIKKQNTILTGLKSAGYEISNVKGVKGEIKAGILTDYGEKIKPKIV